MTTEQFSQIISTSVVPVVIISACGLLCLAFYNRLARIVSRLRTFQKERIKEHEAYARYRVAGHEDQISQLRHQRMLELLDAQAKAVLRRARLIRATLICLLGTIGLLTLCSLATGLSVAWPAAIYAAIACFVAGMILLLTGTLLAMIEMGRALDPVELKRELVTQLAQELEAISNGENENESTDEP